VRTAYDLTALRVVWHLAEPCPPGSRGLIDWLGPERIYELYAGTEGQMRTVITGTEWLEHRGSGGIGPTGGEIQICDPDGAVLPSGTEGECGCDPGGRLRPTLRGGRSAGQTGGWESLGDMGWLDDEGYLYLGDRAQDMILSADRTSIRPKSNRFSPSTPPSCPAP